ncbi:MAG: alpha-amylase family glycosyl hydrolase [Anaerolineales bacterium]
MDDFLCWRDGVIYQIYPRSFADGNDDGLGDLPGILGKLDYLADLGVDALWLSPIYPSPDKDFGYDVADYLDIDPRFGSLSDFDLLLSEAHRRGLKIILDLVLNHTSDQHPWFLESRASRDNPKADWYLWQPSSGSPHFLQKGAGAPNRWQSIFGGSAWTYVPERGQYYYHMFLPEQPDVNWRNPQVRQAMLDVVRFWLERGVDGFRLDVFNMYFKDDRFRENPPKPGLRAFDRQQHVYDCDRPEMIPLLQELRGLLDSYPERYAVGETFLSTRDKIVQYVGVDKLHAAFNFEFTWSKFDPAQYAKYILDWETLYARYGIWPTYVLGNHDVPRMATRHARACPEPGRRGEDDARLKVLMALLLTLRGTPFLYYGEEIGMRDIALKRSEILDPPGKRFWPFYKGRDGCRSPMQWDDTPNAGFSASKPWLPVHPNFRARNVKAQQADPESLFHFTRQLLHLRRSHPALTRGNFTLLTEQPKDILAYLRETPEQKILVALNFRDKPVRWETLPAGRWQALLSSHGRAAPLSAARLELAPCEALLLKDMTAETFAS